MLKWLTKKIIVHSYSQNYRLYLQAEAGGLLGKETTIKAISVSTKHVVMRRLHIVVKAILFAEQAKRYYMHTAGT